VDNIVRRVASKGKCYLCKREYAKGSVKSHLLKCNNLGVGNTDYFMIKVEDFYNTDYWFYIQAKENASLRDLDYFLRDIWLECCQHLSSFRIKGKIYTSFTDDGNFRSDNSFDKIENYSLNDVLTKGLVFKHIYDYGSSTFLKLTVVESYSGISTLAAITPLARNIMKDYKCVKCGETAIYLVMENDLDQETALCEKCSGIYEDENDESYLCKITNSPRMGVCGYEGERDIYKLE
jgi:DNA-directed RNA polymerase subunit RPC12/RpoP